MNAPETITIKSDNNVLTLELQDLKKGMYTYKYTKSISKKNQMLTLNEIELTKLIKQNEGTKDL